MQYTNSYTSLIHIPISKPIGDGYTIFKALSLVSVTTSTYSMQSEHSTVKPRVRFERMQTNEIRSD